MAKKKQGYQQAYYNHEAEWILEIPINRESGRGYHPERGDFTICSKSRLGGRFFYT